jgi:hypothetical protein
VAIVRTDVPEERKASIIRPTRIGGLRTKLAVTTNRLTHIVLFLNVRRLLVTATSLPKSLILFTLMMEALRSSETTVPTRATQRNISEDVILNSHRRQNLKSYIVYKYSEMEYL